MTFFLPELKEDTTVKARRPPRGITGFFEGLGAGVSKGSLENDANFRARRETVKARRDLSVSLFDRFSEDQTKEILQNSGLTTMNPTSGGVKFGVPQSLQEAFDVSAGAIATDVLAAARKAAKENPEAWKDVNLSEESITETVNAKLQAEHQEAVDTLSMMPGGSGIAEFAGGMAGITVDVKNAPFLVMGGGSGSFFRIAAREAAINMAAELAFMPSQFKMAERLDIPDPDISTQLLMAAGAGAGFGVGVEALSRGFRYSRQRNKIRRNIDGFNATNTRVMVDQAEDLLAEGGPDAFQKISEIPARTERAPEFPENTINPDRPPLILRPEDRIGVTPLEPLDGSPRDPLSDANLIENAQKAIDEVASRDVKGARPLTSHLRNNHRLTKSAAARGARAGENLQIHPDGHVGQELKARGITAQTMPGLFSKNGRKDLDNLVASEMEELFPGITEATGTKRGADFIDQDGLIRVIQREIDGDDSFITSRAEARDMQQQLDDAQRGAEASFVAGVNSETPGGVFFTKDEVGLMAPDDLRVVMDDWFERSGYADNLTDTERQEILDIIQKDGGDPEYLVERVFEREADFVEGRHGQREEIEDIPFGETGRQNEQGAGEGRPDAGEARGSNAGEGGRGTDATQSESTPAGEQLVADGIQPITARNRLEAAQNRPLQGGTRAADEGLFDQGARAQTDMFSDVTSPEARAMHDAVEADIRTDIEADGDFVSEIELPDGTTKSMTMAQALDFIDEGDRFSARIDLCGKGPA